MDSDEEIDITPPLKSNIPPPTNTIISQGVKPS